MLDLGDRRRAVIFTIVLVLVIGLAIFGASQLGGFLGVLAGVLGVLALAPLAGWGVLWAWGRGTSVPPPPGAREPEPTPTGSSGPGADRSGPTE